mmetsp:Transcript_31844/g.93780  ORF Transcript_31844/g.93780 Transcript_31844/m.93780 type:complete len:335 (+) Transcript_31844:24-1028(+)
MGYVGVEHCTSRQALGTKPTPIRLHPLTTPSAARPHLADMGHVHTLRSSKVQWSQVRGPRCLRRAAHVPGSRPTARRTATRAVPVTSMACMCIARARRTRAVREPAGASERGPLGCGVAATRRVPLALARLRFACGRGRGRGRRRLARLEHAARGEADLLALLARLPLLPLAARLLESVKVLVLAERRGVVELGRVVGPELAHFEVVDQLLEDVRVAEGLGLPDVLVHRVALLRFPHQLHELVGELRVDVPRRRVGQHEGGPPVRLGRRGRWRGRARAIRVVRVRPRRRPLDDRDLHATDHARLRLLDDLIVERAAQCRCRILRLVVVEVVDNR